MQKKLLLVLVFFSSYFTVWDLCNSIRVFTTIASYCNVVGKHKGLRESLAIPEAGLFFFLITAFLKNEEFNIRVPVLLSNVPLTTEIGGCQMNS